MFDMFLINLIQHLFSNIKSYKELGRHFKAFFFILFFFVITSCSRYTVINYSGISDNSAYYIDVAIDNSNDIIICYKDFANKNRLSAKKIKDRTIDYLGKPAFSNMDCLHNKIIITPSNIPFIAYSDYSINNRLTVSKYYKNKWEIIGDNGISDNKAENIDIIYGDNEEIYVVYTEKDSLYLKIFNENKWSIIYKVSTITGCFDSISDSVKLILVNNNPVIIYTDPDNYYKPVLISDLFSKPNKNYISSYHSMNPKVAIDRNNIIYLMIIETDENLNNNTVLYTILKNKVINKTTLIDNPDNYSISAGNNDNVFIAYRNPQKNNTLSVAILNNGKYIYKKDNLSKSFISSIISDYKRGIFVTAFQDSFNKDKASLVIIYPASISLKNQPYYRNYDN